MATNSCYSMWFNPELAVELAIPNPKLDLLRVPTRYYLPRQALACWGDHSRRHISPDREMCTAWYFCVALVMSKAFDCGNRTGAVLSYSQAKLTEMTENMWLVIVGCSHSCDSMIAR